MASPKGNILYKIYYDGFVAYLGRTKQPLNARLRGHFVAASMHKAISIDLVTKIEFAELPTVADMYLYEIYYINKLKPPINCDDKAKDDLTVSLPELNWIEYDCPLMDKWKAKNAELEAEHKRKQEDKLKQFERRHELRVMHKNGEITPEQYDKELEAIGY